MKKDGCGHPFLLREKGSKFQFSGQFTLANSKLQIINYK